MTDLTRFNLLLVAGEASADLHGSDLLKELKALCPNVHCFGVGGKALAEQGMEIVVPAEGLNVVGLMDWRDKLREVWRHYRTLMAEVKRRRPHGAILLDLPDFNLILAGKLKRLKVPVVYYISPQVWAWRRYRVRKIRRCVERMLVLFPFEKAFYDEHRVACSFVGHPLIERLKPRAEIRLGQAATEAPQIALLPGSRLSELKYHAPILVGLSQKILERYPRAILRLPVASTLSVERVRQFFPQNIEVVSRGQASEILRWADMAIVASGTATLETALIGTPFCLLYRMSRTSAFISHYLIRYRGFLGMPNLLLGREVIREFLQDAANVENLFDECVRLLEDTDYRVRQHKTLLDLRHGLGKEGASLRAALEVKNAMENFYADKAIPLASELSFS